MWSAKWVPTWENRMSIRRETWELGGRTLGVNDGATGYADQDGMALHVAEGLPVEQAAGLPGEGTTDGYCVRLRQQVVEAFGLPELPHKIRLRHGGNRH